MREHRDELGPGLDLAGFTDVDAGDAGAFIGYLDAGAAWRQSGKSRSYEVQGLAAGMTVLDLGCGTGEDVRALAPLVGPAGQVHGVDSSRALVAEAHRRGVPANAAIVAASAYALPFAAATFDAARAERVLQHLERPHEALVELYRVLKPGGSLLVIDHDWETLAVSGGDAAVTQRIVAAFAASLASGTVGREHPALLHGAGFRELQVAEGITGLPHDLALTFVLLPAVTSARTRGEITSEEGDAWLAALGEANRRGEFAYGVHASAVVARR
jgi:SAM-dependent methyltransferase